jgi:VanZ family protein
LKKTDLNKVFRVLPVFLWLAVITILCVIPGEDIPHKGLFSFSYLDKIVHFFMYGILSYLLLWWLRKANFPEIFAILSFSVIYGGIIEIVQTFWATNRSGSWSDLLFDFIGALSGWLVFSKFNSTLILRKILKQK